MSRIRDKNTKPELRVRSVCHALGLRFRLHRKDLQGKPDLVFAKYKTVIFVHGCFFHLHDCKYGQVFPKTNTEFWNHKRTRTRERDQENRHKLENVNWRVLEYWECETKQIEILKNKICTDFNL